MMWYIVGLIAAFIFGVIIGAFALEDIINRSMD